MNFAFELQKDKDLREGGLLQPFKLVSLWDMLELYAPFWFDFFYRMGGLSADSESLQEFRELFRGCHELLGEKPDIPASSFEPKNLKKLLLLLPEHLTEMGFTVSTSSLEELTDSIKKKPDINWQEIEPEFNKFMHALRHEFKGRRLVMLCSSGAQFYKKKGTFLGESVINKLSRIECLREEADEAGTCFALGRYTACVFHLMRVMERCVQKLGNDLGIPEEMTQDKEWQKIVNDIRGRLKILYPKEKDPQRIRYEAILGHLETVKIRWRNPTMHPKATYTEDEAKQIMDAVNAFVTDFSTL